MSSEPVVITPGTSRWPRSQLTEGNLAEHTQSRNGSETGSSGGSASASSASFSDGGAPQHAYDSSGSGGSSSAASSSTGASSTTINSESTVSFVAKTQDVLFTVWDLTRAKVMSSHFHELKAFRKSPGG